MDEEHLRLAPAFIIKFRLSSLKRENVLVNQTRFTALTVSCSLQLAVSDLTDGKRLLGTLLIRERATNAYPASP
jgi:hypothetical protein